MMISAFRIFAILCLTLGFHIHGFVGAVTDARAANCDAVPAVEAPAEGGQAMPEQPAPFCKLIGAAALLHPTRASAAGHLAAGEDAPKAVWPGGPEKPPKRG